MSITTIRFCAQIALFAQVDDSEQELYIIIFFMFRNIVKMNK